MPIPECDIYGILHTRVRNFFFQSVSKTHQESVKMNGHLFTKFSGFY